MNYRIKRVRIERVRIAPARPILSKRFWIAAILLQGQAFSMLPVRFFELKVFLSCMLPCVKYNHASDTAQGCCQEYAGAAARRRWTPTQLGQILCQEHVDVARAWDSFSARMNFRRYSLSWGEGQGFGRRHELTELLRHNSWAPSAMLSNSSQTGKTSTICDTFACFVWGRRPTLGYVAKAQSDLDSNAPGSKT